MKGCKIKDIYFFFLITVLVQPCLIKAQILNYYYGNIHAHTCYSDGNKEGGTGTCPTADYQYAKSSQNFDFLGISEHNHFGAGMTNKPDYANGLAESNIENIDGTFVCLYGMEWGVISTTTTPNAGHVIIYGVNELVGWEAGLYDTYNAKTDYDGLFKKIARYTGGNAFAYLAHPDTSDYSNILNTARNLTYDSAIVGMAIRSGPAFSTVTTYTNPSTSSYLKRYEEALSLGYRVGAGLDHDNHYKTFGRTAQSRLVVMAPSLTKTNIMSGIKNMHIYSSDDWNVKVNFTINGQPLGSDFSASGNPTISVSVSDPDPETTSKIYVTFGVPGSGILPTTLTSTTNSATLNYVHSIANGSSFYYYIHIIQTDGDDIYTSPIWFKRNDVVLPIELISFDVSQKNDNVELNWKTASESNNDYFTIESSFDGLNFTPVTKVKAAGNSIYLRHYQYLDTITNKVLENKIIYYRLKQTDYNLKSTYSSIVSLNYQLNNSITHVTVFPVPASNELNLKLYSKIDNELQIQLTDMMGQLLFENTFEIAKGDHTLGLKLPKLINGTYILKITDANQNPICNRLISIYY